MNVQDRPRAVIVGAGFGGLQAARTLSGSAMEVVLVDYNNHHTCSPLLHQVAAAELEPGQIAFPIRTGLRDWSNVRFCMAKVKGINLEQRLLDVGHSLISYDFLILATGSATRLTAVPGVELHAFPLKSLPQAVRLRNQILTCFEQAIHAVDPEQRRQLLTFVIVGGGATGVEMAGSLVDLVQSSLSRDYHTLDLRSVRIILLHSGDRLLNHLPESLSDYAQTRLRRQGVEIYFHTQVTQVTSEAVQLQAGLSIPTATVIWAAGVQGALPKHVWGLPTTRSNQVAVLSDLSVPGHSNLYAIGDVANFVQDERLLPMLAPVAIAQGKVAAKNILRQLRGQRPLQFRYRHYGSMAVLGRFAAVAQIGPLMLTGFPAWLLWLGVHWVALKGSRQRLLTGVNWLWTYLRRDPVARLILVPTQLDAKTPPETAIAGLANRTQPRKASP